MAVTINGTTGISQVQDGIVTDDKLDLTANSAEVKGALNASGSAPIYACRAWVNFDGTGTVSIRASGNVSSITDNGTGDYTVNFTTAMEDTGYAACFTGTQRATNSSLNQGVGYFSTDQETPILYSTTQVRVYNKISNSGSVQNLGVVSAAIFR